MDLLARFQAGIDQARPIVAAVPRDEYRLPTPCTDWNVEQLVNHMLAALTMFRDTGRDGAVDPAIFGRDLIGDDAARSFDTVAAEVIEVWSEPGKIQGTAALPFGEFPATFALQLPATDMVVHGWDLSKATGQAVRWNAELVSDTLRFCTATFTGPQLRGSAFAAPVEVPDDSDDLTKLVAFLGRQP